MIKAFDTVHKYNIRTTANVIIGMPYEKEEMIMDTIKLIRDIKPKSYTLNFLMPFRGTKMREWAVELGYLPEDHIITNSNEPLDMPEFRRDRIIHYYENFGKYLKEEMCEV
jgi:radical SAM superfamily enzyme YgiQ (UPF0313 family)